jgi:hypothetical protein
VFAQQGASDHYVTKMDFFGKHFSGILTVKAIDSVQKRMVFTTETGFKFFDFKLINDSVEVVDCIEPLRKKGVLYVLTSDLNSLVYFPDAQVLKRKKVKDEIQLTVKTKAGKVKQNRNTDANHITIKHSGLPIKYNFTKLIENETE